MGRPEKNALAIKHGNTFSRMKLVYFTIMKFLLIIISNLLVATVFSQKQQFVALNISLPKEISFYDNQFSGLYISSGKLFLMSESRLQDKAEAKLYSINLSDLDRKMTDTAYPLPYQKYHLYNLDILRQKINAAGQHYEGLEAIEIDGDEVFISVETDTPSPDCFIIKGRLSDTAVTMFTDFLVTIPKPTTATGEHIYNAGFEALAKKKSKVFAFFEYNYFPSNNYVYRFNTHSISNNSKPSATPISKLPFRITDITPKRKNHYTAINYFYKGGGPDSVYRIPGSDVENNKLIKDSSGYRAYCRLIDLKFKGNAFTWQPLWEFPVNLMAYNWEGITAYKNGYFIMNDKYTPEKPYFSTLLYLKSK